MLSGKLNAENNRSNKVVEKIGSVNIEFKLSTTKITFGVLKNIIRDAYVRCEIPNVISCIYSLLQVCHLNRSKAITFGIRKILRRVWSTKLILIVSHHDIQVRLRLSQ